MNVKTVLIVEGLTDIVLLGVKFTVGISTNSTAIISDAFHSLTDLTNNVIALMAVRVAERPSDQHHHYGHRKFEHLAVLGLSVLLMVVALELIVNAVRNYAEPVHHSSSGLWIMAIALVANIALTVWEHYWARRLGSDLVAADAKHTLSDVLTTLAVIVGWQFAANGYYWADTLMALLVAIIIMFFAIRLLQGAIPILVDQSKHEPISIASRIEGISAVDTVRQVRARDTQDGSYADVTITIAPHISTFDAHKITEEIERLLKNEFEINDVVVHVEPS